MRSRWWPHCGAAIGEDSLRVVLHCALVARQRNLKRAPPTRSKGPCHSTYQDRGGKNMIISSKSVCTVTRTESESANAHLARVDGKIRWRYWRNEQHQNEQIRSRRNLVQESLRERGLAEESVSRVPLLVLMASTVSASHLARCSLGE